jgi:hypothetical protein
MSSWLGPDFRRLPAVNGDVKRSPGERRDVHSADRGTLDEFAGGLGGSISATAPATRNRGSKTASLKQYSVLSKHTWLFQPPWPPQIKFIARRQKLEYQDYSFHFISFENLFERTSKRRLLKRGIGVK